jgi:DNA repair exonuclease SbcCD ATPase subunit
MTNEELQQLIASNAKAIEALANERREVEREIARDRARLYQAMADLASAQSGFYQRLADQEDTIGTLSRRQGEIVEILKLLTQRDRPSE